MLELLATKDFTQNTILGGSAVVLTNDFNKMLELFFSSLHHLKAAAVYMQIYSSWICHNALWDQAVEQYFRDYETGDRYERLEDAPPDVQDRLERYEHRMFSNQAEFLAWVESEVPGFSRNTWYARNRTIRHELLLWAAAHDADEVPESVFARIVENVVLNGVKHADLLITTVLNLEPQEDGTVKASLKEDAPTKALGIETDESSPDFSRDLAKKVWDLTLEGHNEISDTGNAHAVVSRMTRQVLGEPKVSAYAGEDNRVWLYVEPREIDESGNWTATAPIRLQLRVCKPDGEEVRMEDWPYGVREFIKNRIRVIL